MALPWITGLGIQAREGEAQGAAEGHHAPVPHPQHMQATRVLGLLAQESFFSLQVSFSMFLEEASIRLGVAKAQHLQTYGQIFLPHAALCFPGLAHRRHLDAHYHHQGPQASSLPSILRSMNCIPTARILSSFFTPLPKKTWLCEGVCTVQQEVSILHAILPTAEGGGGEGGSDPTSVTPQPTELSLLHPRPIYQLSGSQTPL